MLVSQDPCVRTPNLGSSHRGADRRTPARRIAPLFLALWLVSCDDPTSTPALAASTTTIGLSATQPEASLTLRGATDADWRVVAAPHWVRVIPALGSLATDTLIAIAAPGLTDMVPGEYSGEVVFAAAEATVAVRVSAVVGPLPRLRLSTEALTLDERTDTTTLDVTNEGNVSASWRLSASVPWLSATPSSGRLERQARVLVHVRADKGMLPVGISEGALAFTVEGVDSGLTVSVTATVTATAVARFGRPRLVFPRGADTADMPLSNPGRALLEWSVARAPAWLSLHPSAGTLDAGAATSFSVTIDRAAAPTGEWSDTVELATNAGTAVLPVVVTDAGPVVGALWRLPDVIGVARYDRSKGRIVALTADGTAVIILDMSLGITDRVTLPRAGRSLELAPSGRRAVVAVEGYASVVDLDARVVLGTFPAGRVRRPSLTDAGWVYAFPRYGMWDYLRSVNTLTGEQSKDPWLIYGSFGKVHPSGSYLYAVNGWSLEKWDVRAGPARFMYESPIYGLYGYAGDLWFAEDGSRLYTASRKVFVTSSMNDWAPAGELPLSQVVGWLADSRIANRVYVVTMSQTETWGVPEYWAGAEAFRGDAAAVTVFNATTLAALGTIPLPPFVVPDGSGGTTAHPAVGRYVFVDGAGRRVFALVQAPASAGLTADWAVATFDVGTPP